ncbi:Myb/SANT-like DNA-binding domain-containing protein 4 [Taenia solium]|eukprot:TsM_001118100 transcript=TsM_001118100 gene=TsM_001118100
MQAQPHVGIGAGGSTSGNGDSSNSNNNGSLIALQTAATTAFPQASQIPFDAKMGIPQSQGFVAPASHFSQPSMVPSTCTGLPITQLSLAEMESIISPLTRRRSEGFVQQEVKLMIKEIEKRRHILLSMSPVHNRLKKRAWEEVANSMALKRPHEPRRTGEQIKKKWENIVSKTKKKIREGQVTPELDWSETNSMVMQFLAAATQEMRERQQQTALYGSTGQVYEEALTLPTQLPLHTTSYTPSTTASFVASVAPPPRFPLANPNTTTTTVTTINNNNSSTNDDVSIADHKCMSNMGAIFPGEATDGGVSQSARDEAVPEGGALVCKVEESEAERRGPMVNSNPISASAVTVATPIIGDTDEDDGDDEDDDDGASDSDTKAFSSSLGERNDGTTGSRRRHQKRAIEMELLQQARAEHALRMEILHIKRRFWQLKTETLLQRQNHQRPTGPS